jgi:hypothetical protein
MKISTDTLDVTHVFDGENVVTGGTDGQTWVATFSTMTLARLFITDVQRLPFIEVFEDVHRRRFVAKRP